MTISLVDTHTLDAVSVVICAMKEGKEKKKKKNKYTSDYGTGVAVREVLLAML